MRKIGRSNLAPLDENQLEKIDRTKVMILTRKRESKYDPSNCSGLGAAARRLKRARTKDETHT